MTHPYGRGLCAATLHHLLTSPFCRSAWHEISASQRHVRIGRRPVIIGRNAALEALGSFLARTRGFGCAYCEHWIQRETIYAETDMRYLDDDGVERLIPCAVIARVTLGRKRPAPDALC